VNFAYEVFLAYCRGLQHKVKSYDMGPTAYFPSEENDATDGPSSSTADVAGIRLSVGPDFKTRGMTGPVSVTRVVCTFSTDGRI
jgi:hypothetical protein